MIALRGGRDAHNGSRLGGSIYLICRRAYAIQCRLECGRCSGRFSALTEGLRQ